MTKYALISVTNKEGIVDFAKKLVSDHSYKILASGGTGKLLSENGIDIIKISDFTGFQEVLGGRVKTLHPKIHAGILAKNTEKQQNELKSLNYGNIDLVVCNLYDFDNAVDTMIRNEEILEHIDIGGPTLIRAAAKNYPKVTVITDPKDYSKVLNKFETNDLSESYRLIMASKAFRLIANYDLSISKYFGKNEKISAEFMDKSSFDKSFYVSGTKVKDLRYGENSHQHASLYTDKESEMFFNQLHGKNISYNNILDLLAGLEIVNDIESPACSIIKHRTPCGVATSDSLVNAYQMALESDKLSAFGGVYCFNREIDLDTAKELSKMFVDTLIAPGYDAEALKLLKQKEKLSILEMNSDLKLLYDFSFIPGGFVVQQHDNRKLSPSDCSIVTDNNEDDIFEKIKFLWTVVKHARSNAIVIGSENKTFGIASGEPSRVDAVKHAIERAGERTKGAILASDAFFPFPDSVEIAANAGIKTIIVPKGSIRDQESIDTANKLGITLVFSKIRAFKH